MDGIAKAKKRGVRFGRKSLLLPATVKEIRTLREAGTTVPEIIRRTGLSKASIYRALAVSAFDRLSVHVRYAPLSRPVSAHMSTRSGS
jgi:DNA invertase Pin-like site-specific DNA recombinase